MEFGPFYFALFSLAVFRLTHLLVYDSITEGIRKLFLDYEEEQNEKGETETVFVIKNQGWKKWIGELFSCHWCMGIWMSVVLWSGYILFPTVFFVVIAILAAAAVAAIIETVIIQWF